MTILTMMSKMSEGLGRTCAIFFLTLLFALPLGLVVAKLRMSRNKIISAVTKAYISILRGTPLMLQLLAVTYGPYYLFGINVAKEKLIPVVIAFSLNYAAYFAEIYRGGIESISVGQYEAAEVLGYSKTQCFNRIILPQVIKRIIPAVTNEVVTLASIVAEESNYAPEKPTIAGLYLNRLRKGILLQSDPTVKFAMHDFALRRIYNRMLTIDNPYNTYKYAGLPPGPIRVPNVVDIDAVLNYKQHNYIYMCAKEDFSGSHNFAVTEAEHNANANRYRAALNARGIK